MLLRFKLFAFYSQVYVSSSCPVSGTGLEMHDSAEWVASAVFTWKRLVLMPLCTLCVSILTRPQHAVAHVHNMSVLSSMG